MMDIDLEPQLFIPIFQAHKQSSKKAIYPQSTVFKALNV